MIKDKFMNSRLYTNINFLVKKNPNTSSFSHLLKTTNKQNNDSILKKNLKNASSSTAISNKSKPIKFLSFKEKNILANTNNGIKNNYEDNKNIFKTSKPFVKNSISNKISIKNNNENTLKEKLQKIQNRLQKNNLNNNNKLNSNSNSSNNNKIIHRQNINSKQESKNTTPINNGDNSKIKLEIKEESLNTKPINNNKKTNLKEILENLKNKSTSSSNKEVLNELKVEDSHKQEYTETNNNSFLNTTNKTYTDFSSKISKAPIYKKVSEASTVFSDIFNSLKQQNDNHKNSTNYKSEYNNIQENFSNNNLKNLKPQDNNQNEIYINNNPQDNQHIKNKEEYKKNQEYISSDTIHTVVHYIPYVDNEEIYYHNSKEERMPPIHQTKETKVINNYFNFESSYDISSNNKANPMNNHYKPMPHLKGKKFNNKNYY